MAITKRFKKYGGGNPTSHDLFKAVASISMVIDHIGLFFLGDFVILRVVGRLAAPIFFFLIGFSEKRRLEWKLFIPGVLITILSILAFDQSRLNILIFFLIVRWLFRHWDPSKTSGSILLLLFIILAPFYEVGLLFFEYAQIGLFWAIAGRLVFTNSKHSKWWITLSSLATIFWSAQQYELIGEPTLLLCLLIGEFIILGVATCIYTRKTFPMPSIASTPILLLSRLSLEIYVIHLTAFLLFFLTFSL